MPDSAVGTEGSATAATNDHRHVADPAASPGRSKLAESSTPITKRCSACGADGNPSAVFCASCGVPTPRGTDYGQEPRNVARRKALTPKSIGAGLLVLMLSAALGALIIDHRRNGVPSRSSSNPPTTSVTTPTVASSSTTLSAGPSPLPTVSAPDARSAWMSVLGGHPSAASSPVGPLTTTAVVAEGETAFAYRFLKGRWQLRGSLDLGIEAVGNRPVRVADLTGDGEPDFLVALMSGHPSGAVISASGGAWRVVPFAEEYQGIDQQEWVADPRIEGSMLLSDVNDCEPDCASGTHYVQPWSYDELNGVFYPNTGPGTPGGSGE